jgi:hypothetical protein
MQRIDVLVDLENKKPRVDDVRWCVPLLTRRGLRLSRGVE